MCEWLQKMFVYAFSYYFFAYFHFVLTSLFFSWSAPPPPFFLLIWYTVTSESSQSHISFEVIYYPLLNVFWIYLMSMYRFVLTGIRRKFRRYTKLSYANFPFRKSNLRENSFTCLTFLLVYSLKWRINYCCRICIILCMIFKKTSVHRSALKTIANHYSHFKICIMNNGSIAHQHLG